MNTKKIESLKMDILSFMKLEYQEEGEQKLDDLIQEVKDQNEVRILRSTNFDNIENYEEEE